MSFTTRIITAGKIGAALIKQRQDAIPPSAHQARADGHAAGITCMNSRLEWYEGITEGQVRRGESHIIAAYGHILGPGFFTTTEETRSHYIAGYTQGMREALETHFNNAMPGGVTVADNGNGSCTMRFENLHQKVLELEPA